MFVSEEREKAREKEEEEVEKGREVEVEEVKSEGVA